MEFDFSGFFTAVGINIFDLDDLRSVLDDLNKSINFINFDQINDLLLEELNNSFIDFSLQFWIFDEQSLQFACKQMK